MRRLVSPTLKALPFAIAAGMCIYGVITSDMSWIDRGHTWVNTGLLVLLMFSMRRVLTDWPMGELWASGAEFGRKHKKRGPTSLRVAPPPDEQLPIRRPERGRWRA
jgi:hypothetical protein